MTPEQFQQFSDFLERYGLPTLGFLVILFLFYLLLQAFIRRAEYDGQTDLEDTKIRFKHADTIQVLANVLQGNTAALADIKTSMTASVGAYEKLYGLQNEDHKLIEDIHKSEGNITAHIDTLINPYQDIHAGHTRKLEYIMANTDAILEVVGAIRKSVKEVLEETGEHLAVSLDEQKESIE